MREVYFVVLPQLVLLDLAGPAEAFRIANRKMPQSYRLHFTAPTRSLQAAIGLNLCAIEPLPARLPEDALVVLTGVTGDTVDFNEPATQRVINWLQIGVTTQAMLLCVCAGSVIAGKAGLRLRQGVGHPEHVGSGADCSARGLSIGATAAPRVVAVGAA